MYLKRVELHGFKSFADKVAIEFQPGINAIVGPNGSGKSNITDAIRWVLGEQSVKNLRGAKLEDVIFAGSNAKKPMGMAEVSIILDNSDNLLPVEYSEICFTRRVFRSGESEFYINRTPCRLKDIQEILMDTGIGKDGYSIISQGQIDDILTSRPEERRLIFEETAGIMKHKTRKKEAEKRLEETMNNLVRIDDVLAEIQYQLAPLAEQKEKALQYRDLLAQLKEVDVNLMLGEISKKETELLRIKSSAEENGLLLERILHEKSALRESLHTDSRELESKELEHEKTQEELLKNSGRKRELERDLQWARDEFIRLEQESSGIADDLFKMREKIDAAKNDLNLKTEVLEQKIKTINGLELEIADKEQKLFHSDNSIKQKELLVENLKGDVIDLLNFASEKKNKISSMNTMKNNLQNRLNQIDREISQIQEANAKTNCEIGDIKNRTEGLTDLYRDHDKALEELIESLQQKSAELAEMEKLRAKKQSDLSAMISRLKALEEINENLEGYQLGVKNLLNCLKSGRLKTLGIYGTVADIITVGKEYEVAIETALGGALQNIVCDNEENAKEAIEFLKRYNLGRVTFLPLSTIKPRCLDGGETSILSEKGCLGTADRLVYFDRRFYPAVAHLLGRVLVADGIDNALAMARKSGFSLKVVTLEGEVLNPGGSITGGSQKKSSFILSRKRELMEFREKIKQLESELTGLKQHCLQLESEINKKQEKIASVKDALYGLKPEIAALEKELNEKKNLIKEREQRKDRLQLEREQILADIAEIDREISLMEKDIGNIDRKNASSQHMVKALQEEISKEKAVREILARQITELKVKLASCKQEEIGLKQNIQSLEQNMKSWIGELKNLEEKLERNRHARLSTKNKISDIQAELEGVTNLNAELKKKLENLKKEREIIKERLEDTQNRLKKIEEDQRKCERVLNDGRLAQTALDIEIRQIGEKLMEKYGLTIDEAQKLKKDLGDFDKMKDRLNEIQDKIESLGPVNIQAIEDHDSLKARYDFLKSQREDLVRAREKLDNLIREITKAMEEMFINSFKKVNSEFQKIFIELFGGGKAELVIQGDGGLLESGIEIIAQPPGKKLQSLSLLSGGERALTAIALLFAILNTKATPFCILDEIEAALDDANIDRFTRYLKRVSTHTQFIIITHRKNTMAVADALYGIAMEETAVSKVLAVKMES
ncbi:chromosome segregation protein SMC [Thermoanaerobacterium sp. DL9XJH110]|uniref:chromosome segregation protein SMC n=1 Tax=Thermoanaerobacterium sp. DL9XJH110 TaxID=3386643 RepID=UPI003BB48DBE